jgi:amidase
MGTATDELCALSAVDARRRIGTKELSPVELLEACISRIERVNPAVNAVTATDFGRGREAARAAEAAVLAGDPLPLLHGLPIGVKDLNDTAGLLTTYGSPLFRDYVPTKDEAMVARVRTAGGVIFCKTNTPEFGAGANTRNPVWGATGNPFDPLRTAGGSSGGSAVALATGMVPLATGSDTGGSLRIPAAYAGVVGFRPSPGLVPTDGRQFGWSPISVQGPMGRTVADVCLLLGAQAAFDGDDPFSTPLDGPSFAQPEAVDLGSLRCAVSVDLGFAPVDAAYAATFEAKVAAFGGLFRATDRATPDFGEADRCFEVIRAVQFVGRYQETYERDPSLLGPNVRANYEQGAAMSLADFAWAHMEQTRIYRRVQRFFEEYDVLITPTVPITPFPWEQLYLAEMNGQPLRTYFHWLALTYGITLTGHPAVSIPCGVDERGMPFGLQIVGPHRRDRFTLGVAAALEQALARRPELVRPLPDLARLSEETPALRSIVTHPPRRQETGDRRDELAPRSGKSGNKRPKRRSRAAIARSRDGPLPVMSLGRAGTRLCQDIDRSLAARPADRVWMTP